MVWIKRQGLAFLSQCLGKRETQLCEFQGGVVVCIKVVGHPGIHAETLSKQMRTHLLFCILRSWDSKSISETQKKKIKNSSFLSSFMETKH